METYELVDGRSADGTPWYSVVQYVDGVPKGGDHHWLKREYAVLAHSGYVLGLRAFPGHHRV